MRGILLGMCLLAAAFFYAPEASTDLNSLILEETLTVTYQNEKLQIKGETLSGRGTDWNVAMENLYETAAGTVFLETTERILISERALWCLSSVLEDERLRPGTQLYIFEGKPEDTLISFAAAHESKATIAECIAIPTIIKSEGGYRLNASDQETT